MNNLYLSISSYDSENNEQKGILELDFMNNPVMKNVELTIDTQPKYTRLSFEVKNIKKKREVLEFLVDNLSNRKKDWLTKPQCRIYTIQDDYELYLINCDLDNDCFEIEAMFF